MLKTKQTLGKCSNAFNYYIISPGSCLQFSIHENYIKTFNEKNILDSIMQNRNSFVCKILKIEILLPITHENPLFYITEAHTTI